MSDPFTELVVLGTPLLPEANTSMEPNCVPCACGGYWPDQHRRGCTHERMSRLWPKAYAKELNSATVASAASPPTYEQLLQFARTILSGTTKAGVYCGPSPDELWNDMFPMNEPVELCPHEVPFDRCPACGGYVRGEPVPDQPPMGRTPEHHRIFNANLDQVTWPLKRPHE